MRNDLHHPTTSRLTLEKIAELAGVSRSTASRVLRNHGSVSQRARERVLQVVQETGFQPNAAARSLAGHHTNIIGLFITEVSRHIFNDPYFGRLIEGVTQAANQLDQTLTLFLLHEEEDAASVTARVVKNPFVDGVLISNTAKDNPVVPQLLEHNMPFVVVGRHDDPSISYVDADNLGGAHTAVTYLIRQGYQRIGTLTGTMTNYSAIDRLQGYKDALRSRGRSVDQRLIHLGEFSSASGYHGTKKLLDNNVDAIFAASDAIALGAMDAINEAGLRVPDDVAIVGFDDLSFAAKMSPPLTTVRQSIGRSTRMAVSILLDIVANRDTSPHRISLPTEMVVRASTKGVG